MGRTNIVNRYEFETICAGVLRLIKEPSLFTDFYKYLNEEWFFHSDDNIQVKSLRKVVEVCKQLYNDGESKHFTFQYIEQEIPKRILDGTTGSTVKGHYSTWLVNPSIQSRINDEGCFASFVDYLRTLQIAKTSGDFVNQYQSGDILKAAETMRKSLYELDKIGKTSIEVFDPDQILYILETGAQKIQTSSFSMGCEGIDQTMGLFEPQTLNLFISVTNGGKTAMGHHLIREAIKQRKRCFVACLEDRLKSFVYKTIACNTGISLYRLKNNYDQLTTTELAQIRKVKEDLAKYVRVVFTYGKSIDDIHRMALDYDTECKLRGIEAPLINIVDYTQHIAKKTSGDKMYEQMRNAYGERKDFALKYNKICFDFAQVNREGTKKINDTLEDKLLTHADLAGSYDLAQVCDNIITINRNPDDKRMGFCRLHVCKARDGQVGIVIRVKTQFQAMRYEMETQDKNSGWEFVVKPEDVQGPRR